MARRSARRIPNRSSLEDRASVLRRRACRLRKRGAHRKATVAQRELVALSGRPADWVQLGDMFDRAGRRADALQAYRQGLWHYRRLGEVGRARTVAGLVLELDPADSQAGRVVANLAA